MKNANISTGVHVKRRGRTKQEILETFKPLFLFEYWNLSEPISLMWIFYGHIQGVSKVRSDFFFAKIFTDY